MSAFASGLSPARGHPRPTALADRVRLNRLSAEPPHQFDHSPTVPNPDPFGPSMDRVLVTGGAGFIGSHTVDLLVEKGYQVRILDSLQERVHPRGWPSYLPESVERVQGDVCDRRALASALEGVSCVLHLAAYQDYMPDFSTFYRVNTVSTALLFELIVEGRLPIEKVVLASSQAVYGEGKYLCPACGLVYPPFRSEEKLSGGDWEVRCPHCSGAVEPQPIDESTVSPHTAYGISKYALELTALNLGRKYGIAAVNMRYSIVQGPRNSFYNAYSGIARRFTLRLLAEEPPVCYEDGQQIRDYVHVHDVARANLLVLEDPRADYRSFNVGGPTSTRVLEFARLLSRICGVEIEPMISGEYRFGDTRHTFSSWDSLAKLGWRPENGLETILTDYVDWVRAQGTAGIRDFYADSERRMKSMGIVRASSSSAGGGST